MRRLSRWFMAAVTLVFAGGLLALIVGPVWPFGTASTVAVALAGAYGAHRALTWAEARGLVNYRRRQGSFGAYSPLVELANMYDPSARHRQDVVREREWKRDEDDDGDDPFRHVHVHPDSDGAEWLRGSYGNPERSGRVAHARGHHRGSR